MLLQLRARLLHVLRSLLHDALLLPDDAIREAQRLLWKEFKLAVEPAAALGIAELRRSGASLGERVGVVLCGANLDPASLG